VQAEERLSESWHSYALLARTLDGAKVREADDRP
jgi:hypothetical protein